MGITLEQAKRLKPGDVLWHMNHKNADGTPQRWRVNGKVQTWKTDPTRVRAPVKHGLKNYDQLREYDLHLVQMPF